MNHLFIEFKAAYDTIIRNVRAQLPYKINTPYQSNANYAKVGLKINKQKTKYMIAARNDDS
jgi:hypothetical protein